MSPISLTAEEAETIVHARDLLAFYLPVEAKRSGFEDLVLEQLTTIASEINQPLVPQGSEVFMADFLADLVNATNRLADRRAQAVVERGSFKLESK
jgi:hypothetical protein